jgi:hypothetical protein
MRGQPHRQKDPSGTWPASTEPVQLTVPVSGGALSLLVLLPFGFGLSALPPALLGVAGALLPAPSPALPP